jgi:16S rRNA (cytosine967-C5)-methyltransferase
VLTRVETEQAYSNLLLNQTLQKYRPEKTEAALVTELVYGTIQRKNTLDFFLDRFVAKGCAKLEPWVRNLLRLSLYQLIYLDRIPEHAAVNEAVNIAKRKGHTGISGMVNGVLRNVIRGKAELRVPDSLDPVSRIALTESHPQWLVADWVRRFGIESAERMCRSNNEPPRASVRVNGMKLTPEALLGQLEESGYSAHRSSLSAAGVVVESGGNMALTPWYANGELSIQDESSMLVAEMVDPEPGMDVLDCCAAPGGKTAHIAELMNNSGRILACDLHEHKRELIEAQSKRLGLRIVETKTIDARKLPEALGGKSFDRILLDAPCSGLGVIRRKPDIKWAKSPDDVADIAKLQTELLSGVASLLAPGGILVYSTCTISEEENERVIERFLRDYPDFSLEGPPAKMLDRLPEGTVAGDGTVTVLPHRFGSDGFFIARLRRRAT